MNDHVMLSLSDGVINRCDPLGARCVMGAIELAGLRVQLLEDRLEPRDSLIGRVAALHPQAVWVSVQPGIRDVIPFLEGLTKFLRSPIIVGNVGVRGIANQLVRQIPNSYVVLGQGEDSAFGIADSFSKQGSMPCQDFLHRLPNLMWLDRGSLCHTQSTPSKLANSIVPSNWGLREAVARHDIISARSSSGCDASCTFCTVRAINNGQRWRPLPAPILEAWLERVVAAGAHRRTVRLVDDDLAGSISNLLTVVHAFKNVNERTGAGLRFSLSTRSAHLVQPGDAPDEAFSRARVWREACGSGLEAVFLGLEAGSDSQLKRLGKNCTAETNYAAVDFAQSLGISIEVGFIPVDPMMNSAQWRDEMRANVRLARHCRVWTTSPTWLAPARAYRESPLFTWLSKRGQLGPYLSGADEYLVRYSTSHVVQFLRDLGPAFCEGEDNGLYALKREIKTLQRYPTELLASVAPIARQLIESELRFVDSLLDAANQSMVVATQLQFAEETIHSVSALEVVLSAHSCLPHANTLLGVTESATQTLRSWVRALDCGRETRKPCL